MRKPQSKVFVRFVFLLGLASMLILAISQITDLKKSPRNTLAKIVQFESKVNSAAEPIKSAVCMTTDCFAQKKSSARKEETLLKQAVNSQDFDFLNQHKPEIQSADLNQKQQWIRYLFDLINLDENENAYFYAQSLVSQNPDLIVHLISARQIPDSFFVDLTDEVKKRHLCPSKESASYKSVYTFNYIQRHRPLLVETMKCS